MSKKQLDPKKEELKKAEEELRSQYEDGKIPFDVMMKLAVNTTPASKSKSVRKKSELITEGKVNLAELIKKVATAKTKKEDKKDSGKKKKN